MVTLGSTLGKATAPKKVPWTSRSPQLLPSRWNGPGSNFASGGSGCVNALTSTWTGPASTPKPIDLYLVKRYLQRLHICSHHSSIESQRLSQFPVLIPGDFGGRSHEVTMLPRSKWPLIPSVSHRCDAPIFAASPQVRWACYGVFLSKWTNLATFSQIFVYPSMQRIYV